MSVPGPSFILIGPEDKARIADSNTGLAPRLDYRLVAEMLDATVVECAPPPTAFRGHKAVRLLRSLAGNFRAALSLVRQAPHGSIVYSTGETWGLPLALVGAVLPKRHYIHVAYVHRVFSPAWLKLLRSTRHWLATDGWICVTQRQAQQLRQVLNPGAPVAVVSQGVDASFFDPAKAIVPQSDPYILAVGAEMRNYEILNAAARHFDARVIVKASSAWMVDGRSQVGALPANVQLHGERLSYVELRSLYAGAATVVAPLHDTLQAAGITTILEAMAMGKPVIATRSAGLPDLLIHGQTGMIVEPSADALARAIVEMLSDAERRAMLSSAAMRRLVASATVEQHARQIADFIAALDTRRQK